MLVFSAERAISDALEGLLAKAEKAYGRDQSREGISLPCTPASYASYFGLAKASDRDQVHARLRAAETYGAIVLDWDRRAEALERVHLRDADKLGEWLGRKPLWVRMAHAADALAPYADAPLAQNVLAYWKSGKLFQAVAPEDAALVGDAFRLIRHCATLPSGADVTVRRVSAQLFRNSKHIESLRYILTGLLPDGYTEFSDQMAYLGLVRHPQPMLLAGHASIQTRQGSLVLPKPYLGVAPAELLSLDAGQARWLLTVENLTIFHELAVGQGGPLQGLVLYTGGMPSPAFVAAYLRILDCLPEAALYHWGDIDRGGFRIAQRLHDVALGQGRPLALWQMNAARFGEDLSYKDLNNKEVADIEKIANACGWLEEGDAVRRGRRAFEQEVLPLALPAA